MNQAARREPIIAACERMANMENKSTIITTLAELLELTRGGSDVAEIYYIVDDHKNEFAVIRFRTGCEKRVNVTGCSGLAIIDSVTRALF